MTEREHYILVTALSNYVQELETDFYQGGQGDRLTLEAASLMLDEAVDARERFLRDRQRDIERARRATILGV